LPGATSSGAIDTTKPLQVTKSYTAKTYSDDLTAYNKAVNDSATDPTKLATAKLYRNNIIWGEMASIETVYAVYHTRLFSDKNTISVASDAMTLGLTAASTIAGNTATKTTLSALGTAFAGLGLSVDKNFFSQQSFQVLGLAMQTRRDKVRARIAANLALCDVILYPLSEGQRDLIQYFGAGTLDSALQELQEEAGVATAASSTGSVVLTAPSTTCPIVTPQVSTPSFSPPANSYLGPQSVIIATATAGATIYYSVDGSTPTTSSTVYAAPITVSSTKTIQAMATAPGYGNSALASAAYTITLRPAATPTFTPPAGSYTAAQTVAIATTTPGATIYYTVDGSTPTTSSTVYTAPVAVSSTQIIQAIATATSYGESALTSAAYTIIPRLVAAAVATPTFTPPAGSYTAAQTVAIATTTPGATIYYTVDGSPPTTSSTVYTAPVAVSSTKTIQAMATLTGYGNSALASAAYTIALTPAATPTFTPPAGSYTAAQTVAIATTTPGATIYYTVDGSTPTTSSTVYTAAVAILSTKTIQAMATAAGYGNSALASAAYTISAAAAQAAAAQPGAAAQPAAAQPGAAAAQPALTPH
jgi:hypothetical protein